MKKALVLCLALLLALSAVACSNTQQEQPPQEESAYTPGTYTATATGMKGDVTVEVTVDETSITDVAVSAHTETYGIGYGLKTSPVEVVPAKIVETQSLNIDNITGATITTNAILNAAADALTQAGGDADALKAKEVPVEATQDETLEADVVVLGAGAAGLAAGIEAANAGADVIILEKQGVTGGATARSGGKLLAAGTTWQEKQNIEDDPQLMYDYLKGIGGDLIDDAKLQEFCDNAVADMTWLEDMGVKVQDVEAIHQSLTPWRVHNTLGGGGMTDGHGGQITVPMTEKFLGLGGQILYNVSADTLLTDDSGVVCGASGTRPDGTTVSVNAKAVVIATGGYAANTELVEEYTGKTGYVTQVPAGNVGDGLMMAEAVGAAIYKPTTIQTVFTSFTCGVGINEEAGLIVNSRGERVVNEYTYQYHVAEAIINSGCYSGWYIASAADPNPMVQYGITLDSTLKAATAEELGELMGVDPEAFAAVVERYNELCAKGSDDDFGKPADKMIALEGELYAILLSPAATVSYGGLVTDIDSRVLNTENEPIENLYAAGEVAFTGLFGTEYPCCGMAIGGSVRFGRIAGAMAAQEQ